MGKSNFYLVLALASFTVILLFALYTFIIFPVSFGANNEIDNYRYNVLKNNLNEKDFMASNYGKDFKKKLISAMEDHKVTKKEYYPMLDMCLDYDNDKLNRENKNAFAELVNKMAEEK